MTNLYLYNSSKDKTKLNKSILHCIAKLQAVIDKNKNKKITNKNKIVKMRKSTIQLGTKKKVRKGTKIAP